MGVGAALRLDRSAFARLVLAGGGWGLSLAAFFFAIDVPQCGPLCPADVAVTTAICVGTGLATIGPFAAYAGRRR